MDQMQHLRSGQLLLLRGGGCLQHRLALVQLCVQLSQLYHFGFLLLHRAQSLFSMRVALVVIECTPRSPQLCMQRSQRRPPPRPSPPTAWCTPRLSLMCLILNNSLCTGSYTLCCLIVCLRQSALTVFPSEARNLFLLAHSLCDSAHLKALCAGVQIRLRLSQLTGPRLRRRLTRLDRLRCLFHLQ